jgi:hypothetical protein
VQDIQEKYDEQLATINGLTIDEYRQVQNREQQTFVSSYQDVSKVMTEALNEVKSREVET